MQCSERIRQVMLDKSLNIPELSSALGISKRTIESYLQAGRPPGPEFLAAMTTQLGVSASWILTGEGHAYTEARTNAVSSPPDFTPIPRYAVEASAGHGALIHDEEGSGYYAYNRKFLERRGLKPDNLAVISVKGDSMEPELYDGDLILLDRAQTTPRDSRIYAVRYNSDLFVKRVMELPGNRIQLLSTNANYPPITVDATELDSIQIIGRVVNSTHEW